MTVKLYVSSDSQGRERPPDTSHEVVAAEEIAKSIWKAYHHLDRVYAVIANLRKPSADMVILTERGLGMVELKHYGGEIIINSYGNWFAGNKVISSGAHDDPHKQVQDYGEAIRRKVLRSILPQDFLYNRGKWNEFKFQTTVCITHPAAKVDQAKSAASTLPRQPWESSFIVTTIPEVADWVSTLRFHVKLGPEKDYQPYELSGQQVIEVAQSNIGSVEWAEILGLMPTGEPFGYLKLLDNEHEAQIFNLYKDETIVGRDPNADIIVPHRFSLVSRRHLKIIRTIEDVFVEDCGSSHGTFIGGQRIMNRRPIRSDEILVLAAPEAGDKVCSLQFVKPTHGLEATRTDSK